MAGNPYQIAGRAEETYKEMTNNTEHGIWYVNDPPDGPPDAYNGNVTKVGLAFDAAGIRKIFYIGEDAGLYQMQEQPETDEWRKADRQEASRWPVAESPSSDFAVTFEDKRDKIWIYYIAGVSLTQVHQSSSGVWEKAVALPKYGDTSVGDDDPADDDGTGSDVVGGLSGGAKAGIGAGVGVGVPVVALAAAFAFFRMRRARRRDQSAELPEAQEVQAMATGPAAAAAAPATPQELYASPEDGQWRQNHDPRLGQKYSSPPVYHELLAQGPTYGIARDDGQVSEGPASLSPSR